MFTKMRDITIRISEFLLSFRFGYQSTTTATTTTTTTTTTTISICLCHNHTTHSHEVFALEGRTLVEDEFEILAGGGGAVRAGLFDSHRVDGFVMAMDVTYTRPRV